MIGKIKVVTIVCTILNCSIVKCSFFSGRFGGEGGGGKGVGGRGWGGGGGINFADPDCAMKYGKLQRANSLLTFALWALRVGG